MRLHKRYRAHRHTARLAWAPSPLRRVLRHRFVRAGAFVAVGLAASATWTGRMAALDQAQAQWGALTPVLVVVEPIEIGEPIAGSVEVRHVPQTMVPRNALAEAADGSLAKAALYPDEVLLVDRVAGSDSLGPASGTVALTLSTVASTPLIDEGDLIDVWAVDSANVSSRRIAKGVVVLFVASDEITIAVPESQVAETTAAALRPVVITLVG